MRQWVSAFDWAINLYLKSVVLTKDSHYRRVISNASATVAKKKWKHERNKEFIKTNAKAKKEYFDAKHFTIDKEINKNDLVLLHDTQHENDRSINRKLKYRWRKSFRIKEIIQDKRTYLLQKLDETDLAEIFVENKIKKFHQRQILKISSSVSSNSIMNDHEFIDENDVMKKIFDSQSLMSEELSLAMIIS
jgi:hypothetical protein